MRAGLQDEVDEGRSPDTENASQLVFTSANRPKLVQRSANQDSNASSPPALATALAAVAAAVTPTGPATGTAPGSTGSLGVGTGSGTVLASASATLSGWGSAAAAAATSASQALSAAAAAGKPPVRVLGIQSMPPTHTPPTVWQTDARGARALDVTVYEGRDLMAADATGACVGQARCGCGAPSCGSHEGGGARRAVRGTQASVTRM